MHPLRLTRFAEPEEETPVVPEHIAEPVAEEADFLLRSELSPEQGVFFGDLITLKAPFSANTYVWKKDGKVLDAHGPDLVIKAFTPEDIGEYCVEDDLRHSSATIVLGAFSNKSISFLIEETCLLICRFWLLLFLKSALIWAIFCVKRPF